MKRNLTSQTLKNLARRIGAGGDDVKVVGIAPVSRFDNARERSLP